MADLDETLVALEFRRSDLGPVRHLVARRAADVGLFGHRLHSFVLAVNEITTNAVVHGGGFGRLRLWLAGRQLVCEISDTGPGMPGGRVPPDLAPPTEATGGRGLWLTPPPCDAFSVRTDRTRTTVRPAPPPPRSQPRCTLRSPRRVHAGGGRADRRSRRLG